MRACVCACCGGRQRERKREIGKWGLLCVHAVVAVDVNMREVGRWGCHVCVLWAVDVNSREVERWGSQGVGGWMCCGGH